MSERIKELLLMAADKFEQASHPFNSDTLSEYNVTLDEVYDLSAAIASIIRCHLSAPPELRAKMVAAYAIKQMGGNVDAAMSAIDRDAAMRRVLQKLEDINSKKE